MDSTSIHDYFIFGRGSHRWALARDGAWLSCRVSFAQMRELANRTSLAAFGLNHGILFCPENHHFSLVLEAFAQCKTRNAILVASPDRLPFELSPSGTGEQQRA